MNILVTGANEQLGNEMRIVSKNTTVHYVFTDVNLVEGQETTYLDFTDMDSIRKMVKSHNIQAIVNSEVKKKKLNLIKR
ncbi:sugar nucleotide-binding protein [Segatella copri]|uniref:sugar nucleotide-binding protein n=1 Tax=Segatella copri TaxID=165179 RepID=UPI002FF34059